MSQIEKDNLRKQYISIRKNIQNKKIKSKIIMEKVTENTLYKNSKVVALYKSLDSEVDTDSLIDYTLKANKTVVLPKVVKNELKFFKISSLDDNFIKSNFGVLEPIENEENFISKEKIDLVIVPGVCFDKNNNRIGFGKGYYDKFLKDTNLKTMAICFKEQITNEIPLAENDVKMQYIITD